MINVCSSCSGDFLALLSSEGGQDVGFARVELHHLLGDQRILSSHGLQLLPGLDQVGVGEHLPVLRHLLDHSLVVALRSKKFVKIILGVGVACSPQWGSCIG